MEEEYDFMYGYAFSPGEVGDEAYHIAETLFTVTKNKLYVWAK